MTNIAIWKMSQWKWRGEFFHFMTMIIVIARMQTMVLECESQQLPEQFITQWIVGKYTIRGAHGNDYMAFGYDGKYSSGW